MRQRIVLIVTIVLIACLSFFLWNENKKEQKQVAKYEELNEKLRPLKVQKEKLQQELVDLEKNYEIAKIPKGTTQVLFTDLNEQVYTICYPIMKDYGYTGTLALSLSQLPGTEGCMNLEQFRELIDAGWDVCIKWDNAAKVNDWWPQLQEQLKQLGLTAVPTVYFTTGTYTAALDAQLQQMGFSIVVHHGEEGRYLIQLADEAGLWHLGAVGFMGDKPKLRLREAVAQKGNIVFLVGFELEDEIYNEKSFVSMLGYFDSYSANEELIVANMEETRQHYRERLAEYETAKEEEYKQAKAALEAELTAVEAEIAELEAQ